MAWFDKGAQDVVYSMEEGWAGKILRGFVWLVIAVGIFAFYGWMQFRGLKDPEAMEYAQIGRQLADGAGFVTKCIRPVDVGYTARQNYSPTQFPDLRHAPLYPAALAAGFKMIKPSFAVRPKAAFFEPESKVVVPLGILFSLGTGLMVFLLGRRLFDGRVGFVSTGIFFLSDAVLSQSISGTPIPMLTFLVAASCYAALVSSLRLSSAGSFLSWLAPLSIAALLCGLAFLTGYTAIVLVPALVVFVGGSREQGRWSAILIFLVVFTLVVSPWLVRNKSVSGEFLGLAPYAVLGNSSLYEADSFDQELKPVIHNVKAARALKAKVVSNLGRLWEQDLRTVGTGFIICFFIVSFFHRFERETVARFRWCLALGIVLMLLLAALAGGDAGKLLGVFLPLMILYGVAFLLVVVERAEYFEAGWDIVLAVVLVLLTALPAVFKLMGPPAARPYPPYFPPFQAYICSLIEPSETLCTDIPWATAWYGNRVSILRPRTLDAFNELGKTAKISGVYLTSETGNKPYTDALLSGDYSSWLPLLNRTVPSDFMFTNGIALPPGSRDQLFLSDRIRWKESPAEKAE
jgi:hypothetical protein